MNSSVHSPHKVRVELTMTAKPVLPKSFHVGSLREAIQVVTRIREGLFMNNNKIKPSTWITYCVGNVVLGDAIRTLIRIPYVLCHDGYSSIYFVIPMNMQHRFSNEESSNKRTRKKGKGFSRILAPAPRWMVSSGSHRSHVFNYDVASSCGVFLSLFWGDCVSNEGVEG